LDNLRLVCTRANEAKGNMTDDEFLELCRNVIRKSSDGQS
jgi:5-methylcytosine-specific restriction endonuclease McrA